MPSSLSVRAAASRHWRPASPRFAILTLSHRIAQVSGHRKRAAGPLRGLREVGEDGDAAWKRLRNRSGRPWGRRSPMSWHLDCESSSWASIPGSTRLRWGITSRVPATASGPRYIERASPSGSCRPSRSASCSGPVAVSRTSSSAQRHPLESLPAMNMCRRTPSHMCRGSLQATLRGDSWTRRLSPGVRAACRANRRAGRGTGVRAPLGLAESERAQCALRPGGFRPAVPGAQACGGGHGSGARDDGRGAPAGAEPARRVARTAPWEATPIRRRRRSERLFLAVIGRGLR